MRMAISPRLATRIFLNMALLTDQKIERVR